MFALLRTVSVTHAQSLSPSSVQLRVLQDTRSYRYYIGIIRYVSKIKKRVFLCDFHFGLMFAILQSFFFVI